MVWVENAFQLNCKQEETVIKIAVGYAHHKNLKQSNQKSERESNTNAMKKERKKKRRKEVDKRAFTIVFCTNLRFRVLQ